MLIPKQGHLWPIRVVIIVFAAIVSAVFQPVSGQAFQWNGSQSADWSNSLNWTPAGIPDAGATVNIGTGPFPFLCNLDQDRTLQSLAINGGFLHLNGHTLVTTGAFSAISGVVEQGRLNVAQISALTGSHLKQVVVDKYGTGNTDLQGGNHFEDVTFIHNSSNRIRFAQNQGDTFSGNTLLQKLGTGLFQLSFNDTSRYSGPLTIDAPSAGGTISFGQGGGHTEVLGNVIGTSGFSGTLLTMQNVRQSGAGGGAVFHPTELRFTDCEFEQKVFIDAGTSVILEQSQFTDSVFVRSPRIIRLEHNSFSEHLSIEKTGTSNDNIAGGNDFSSISLRHLGTGVWSMGNVFGDSFHGEARFEKLNTGDLRLSNGDTSRFYGDIVLVASSSGRLAFGFGGGVTYQSSGGRLLSAGFTSANLDVRRYYQDVCSGVALFFPVNLHIEDVVFYQKFTFDCQTRIDVISSDFHDSVQFMGVNMSEVRNSRFFTQVHFLKRSGSNNTWFGQNLFTDGSFRNESNSGYLRLAGTSGDEYFGVTRFEKAGTSNLLPALNDTSYLQGIVYFDNSSAGTLGVGAGSGVLIFHSSAVIRTNGFTGGTLQFSRIIQSGVSDFSLFQPQTLEIHNSELSQRFYFDVSGAATLTQSEFGDSVYIAADNITNVSACKFSTQVSLIKRGGTNNTWTGGNEFTNATIRNESSSGYIRMANSVGDQFYGTTIFDKASDRNIEAMRSDTSYVYGDLFLNNSTTGSLTLGGNGGLTYQFGTAALRTSGFTGGVLTISGYNQEHAALGQTFTPNQLDIRMSTISQPLRFHSVSSYEIQNSVFADSFAVSAVTHAQLRENQFQGPAEFEKTSGSNNSWYGGNQFSRVMLRNQSNAGFIRSGISLPDLFLGDTYLEKQGTSGFQLGRVDTTYFHGNIFLSNSLTGTIEIGTASSTVIMQSGSALKNAGFSNGLLRLRNVIQEGSSASDTLDAETFELEGVSMGGPFFLRSSYRIQIERCELRSQVWMQALSFNVLRESVLGSPSHQVYLEKTGSEFNSWYGENTFYNLRLVNKGTAHIRQAATRGDTLYGVTVLQRMNTGSIIWAHADTTVHYGGLSFVGSASLPELASSGSGWIAIRNSGNAQIQGNPSMPPRFNRLLLETTDTLILSTPVWIDGELRLRSGILRSTSANFLGFPNGAVSNPGTDSGFVDGPLRFRVATNANSLSMINFATGSNGNWWPVQLGVSHTNNEAFIYEIQSVLMDAATIPLNYPPGVTNISNVRLMRIRRFRESDMSISPNLNLRTSGPNAPFIRMYYSSLDSINEPHLITLLKTQPGNDSTWQDIGGAFGTDSHGDYVEASGFTSFSDFTFGNQGGDNPLPITLLSFSALRTSPNSVKLNWETAVEIDNAYFSLERAGDGINWELAGIVQGAGNSNEMIRYTFEDADAGPGLLYYRLRQTDFDGTSSVSEVRVVQPWVDQSAFHIYPQPSIGYAILQSYLPQNPGDWILYDAIGKSYPINYEFVDGDTRQVRLYLNQLPPGHYFIRTKEKVQRLIVAGN